MNKDDRSPKEREAAREEFLGSLRRVLAFDKAMAELHNAGLADEFVAAIERDPHLLEALNKLTPNLGRAATPGWSCCITVSDPMRRSPKQELIFPVAQAEKTGG